jgi:hypothetical protein
MEHPGYSNDGPHRTVAEIDFGLYQWKAHTTGYLIKWMRSIRWSNEDAWDHTWEEELYDRISDELARRPHIVKKGRKQNKNPSKRKAAKLRNERSKRRWY